MTIKDFKDHLYQTLSPLYDVDEINGLYARLLAHLFNFGRAEAALQTTLKMTDQQTAFAQQAIKRLQNAEPLQYVLGYTDFYGLRLEVSPAVLIPRPETEELVGLITEKHRGYPPHKILDIGTGSGCIALALKKNWLKSEVSGLDLSEEALLLARRNSAKSGLKVNFFQADVFNWHSDEKFDIIVSNPPYVKQKEKNLMRENVLRFEPHLALFVPDDDPLVFYKKIIELSKKQLRPGGGLYFEINEQYGEIITDLMIKQNFSDVSIRTDLYQKHRMVKGLMI